jgi:hypothetical protein
VFDQSNRKADAFLEDYLVLFDRGKENDNGCQKDKNSF